MFSSRLFECSNHFALRLCGGGEIQHSEIRLFLFGVNSQSVTLKRRELVPENLNFFVDLKLSFYFQSDRSLCFKMATVYHCFLSLKRSNS